MNKTIKNTCMALAGMLALSSCSGDLLDTNPTTGISVDEAMGDVSKAKAPLNGIYRLMYTYGWSVDFNGSQCFGISSYNLMADLMGEDMIMQKIGSGWFWYDCVYDLKDMFSSAGWRPYDLWNAYYTLIANANYILSGEETMEGDENEKAYVLGQAYAIRAYNYFMLAQTFARTYDGHQDDPCVPIYKERTFTTTTGQPRSSVKDVYAQIDADLKKALDYLEKVPNRQDDPTHMSYAVTCGLKARVCLVENNWADAQKYAEEAIDASGASIMSPKDFAGVNDATKDNVMWGAAIVSDQVGGYASFCAHIDTLYYGARAPKQIARNLYDKMNETDARRSWWDTESNYNTYDEDKNVVSGYEQDKFHFKNITSWEGDYIWMRVEEMYLTAAEAACRQGNDAKAREYLTDLMSSRDTDYDCSGKSGTELGKLTTDETGSLLEEIITQRRIELWGEFGRIYDIRRLRQGFRRTTAMGWPSNATLSSRPTDDPECYMWVLTIPQAEFDGNENMDFSKDQNPVGDYPSK